VKIQGWDLALNHSACVELTDGELTGWWYVTDRKADADRGKGRGTYYKTPDRKKQPDRHRAAMERLAFMEGVFASWLSHSPDFVGIEHYAMGQSTNAYHIGELGGVARMLCWSAGVPFRLHGPGVVKMFVAHDGSCQKDEVERAVEERWGFGFSTYNANKEKRQTSEDLADAFGVAQMVWAEVRFRRGDLQLSELHPKEVQVFNRITKAMPLCLIDREWIQDA
jgi:Holliday junction resolvasome RuvABC endonuclease subunit